MRRPARLPRLFRTIGRQWYAVSAVYAGIGVLVVLWSMFTFDWMGVVAGYLGAGIALSAAVIVGTVSRIGKDLVALRTTLRDVRGGGGGGRAWRESRTSFTMNPGTTVICRVRGWR